MQVEQRKYPRYTPPDLHVQIAISPPAPNDAILLAGTVLNMSQQGIKIKLDSPMPAGIPESKIEIQLTLPKSGLPLKIKGTIRHMRENTELGMEYFRDHSDDELNNMLLECVRVH